MSTATSPLATIKQFADRNPAFTENSLRWLIFKASNPADPVYAKFCPAIHKVGRRVLIEEQKFLAIAMGKNGKEAA